MYHDLFNIYFVLIALGTKLVADLNVGTESSFPHGLTLLNVNGKFQLYFWATTVAAGIEPYRMEVQYLSSIHEANNTVENIFSISPNPAQNEVLISFYEKENFAATQWQLSNLNGQIFQKGAISDSQNVQINLSDLSAGLYFIAVQDRNGKQSVEKVMIQR